MFVYMKYVCIYVDSLLPVTCDKLPNTPVQWAPVHEPNCIEQWRVTGDAAVGSSRLKSQSQTVVRAYVTFGSSLFLDWG